MARFKPILAFLCVSAIALSLAACSSSDYKEYVLAKSQHMIST